MSRFTKNVLQALSNIYHFEGSPPMPEEMPLDRVILVHDVSREVERVGQLNAAPVGYRLYILTLTPTAADVYTCHWNPFSGGVDDGTLSPLSGLDIGQHSAWFLGADMVAKTDGANFTFGGVWFNSAALATSNLGGVQNIPVWSKFFDGLLVIDPATIMTGATASGALLQDSSAVRADHRQLMNPPIQVNYSGKLAVQGWVKSAAARDAVYIVTMWWIGAKGASPPGFP